MLQIINPTRENDKPMLEPSALRRQFGRSLVAGAVSQLLLSQHCLEEGVAVRRLQDLDPKEAKPFIDAGEFITELTLSRDRFDSALMAAADVICMNGAESAGVQTIFDVSKPLQQHYYQLAVSAFHAIQENVKEVPPDWNYRDQLCRTLDTFAPKDGVR